MGTIWPKVNAYDAYYFHASLVFPGKVRFFVDHKSTRTNSHNFSYVFTFHFVYHHKEFRSVHIHSYFLLFNVSVVDIFLYIITSIYNCCIQITHTNSMHNLRPSSDVELFMCNKIFPLLKQLAPFEDSLPPQK